MSAARKIGIIAAIALTCMSLAQAQDGGPVSCGAETLGIVPAGPALDGRTFRLKDGREVRLAGIEVPPGTAAKDALEKLLGGRLVVLKRLESANDRYGHLVAHVFALRDDSEGWLQQEMVAAGLARAGVRIGPACAAALLAAERTARAAKLGLWADPSYAIWPAEDATALLAQRGRFGVAEGKVLSVRESGGTIYVNFGRVWSRSLTVTILKRHERGFAASGLELTKKLEGRRVRVRGWVEERGGPRIEASRPEQIEIVDRD
jgi:hypothetical protein